MNAIWAKRLIAGTQRWDDVPLARREAVQEILNQKVESEELTQDEYNEILGIEEA